MVFFVLFLAAFAVAEKGLTPKLGIDLQGGTRVTLIPIGQPDEQDLRLAQDIIRDRVDGLGVAGTSVVIEGSNIVLTVPGEDSSQARDLGTTSQLTIRPVLEVQPVAEGDVEPVDAAVGDRDAVARAVEEALEVRQGDPQELSQRLPEFRCPEREITAGFEDQAQALIACGEGAKYVLGPVPLLVGEPEDGERLDGQQIVKDSVSSGINQRSGRNEVSFRFLAGPGQEGSATWTRLTQENLNRQIAMILDGQVISAPVVEGVTPVGGTTSISGQFTMDEAAALAANLRYGALPISFEDPNVDNVPASLGLASLEAGLLAGAIGFLLVLLYTVLYYRLLGVIAFLSLAISFLITYVMLVFLGYTVDYSLDLAGVAGLIIGIGMTADSYVVFFERIKDELRDGHRFRSSVPRAWKSASRTIITGNVVSLIGAVVLYLLATGEVRGFAFTLALSTVMDVLVAFTVLWPLVYLASTKPLFTKPWANGLGRMEALRVDSAERRRLEQEAEKDGPDSESGGTRGVSATVRGPDGPPSEPGPATPGVSMILPRRDDSEEEGR
nr:MULTISPECIES: protein translocase subunit SecD [unclassified Dietzia]